MESLDDLFLPFLMVISISYYCSKQFASPAPSQDPAPVLEPGVINVNIFRGRNSSTLALSSESTPRTLIPRLFTYEEVQGKQVIFVSNGRRLNNDTAIGLQGVRNGNFLHTQIVESSEQNGRNEEKSGKFVIYSCCSILLLLWGLYFSYPKYFSFTSRTILIGLSEILSIFIYKKLKVN